MIYVASSWRNERYEGVLDALTQWDLPYYNWRDEQGFHWSEVMPETEHIEHWTEPIDPNVFIGALRTARAKVGFLRDMSHLMDASAVILLLPCGKSAHLEAGWAAGAGKPLAIYLPEPVQPELMYGMADLVTTSLNKLMHWANDNHTNWKVPVLS